MTSSTDKNSQYLHGACGDIFKEILSCYQSSTSLIRGLECVDMMKDYHGCCQANPGACAPEIEAIESAEAIDINDKDQVEEAFSATSKQE